MDKQMIEEMAKDVSVNCDGTVGGRTCFSCRLGMFGRCIPFEYAKRFYKAGYRKIPDGAVVLTGEEYERLTEENGQLKGYNSGLEYENAELQKQVDELLNRRIEPKIFQCHADVLENCPKVEQAVMKFAERLKDLVAERNCNENYDWEDVQIDGQIFVECVDEIAKELTGGKE